MAILALVASGLALGGLVLSSIVPLLFFGLFTAFLGEGIDEGSFVDGAITYTGRVELAADGSVSGPALAGAVVPMVSQDAYDGMAERTSCDSVPHVTADVSVLCRADDPAWYGVVRFTGTDGSFELIAVGDTQGSIP